MVDEGCLTQGLFPFVFDQIDGSSAVILTSVIVAGVAAIGAVLSGYYARKAFKKQWAVPVSQEAFKSLQDKVDDHDKSLQTLREHAAGQDATLDWIKNTLIRIENKVDRAKS